MSRRPLLPVLLFLTLVFPSLPAAAAILTTGRPVELTTSVFEPKALNQPVGRIAGSDAGFLAVYLVRYPDSTSVYADRLRAGGSPLDFTAPLLLGNDAGAFFELAPAVAAGSDGTFLTAWSTPNGIRARTVTVDGLLGQPLAITNGYDRSQVYVAFNGEVFLVLWDGGAVTVSPSGQILRRFPFSGFGSNEAQLVATGATFQLVTLQSSTIVTIAITAQGSVSPPVTVAPAPAAVLLRAAARDEELLVAWSTIEEGTGASTAHVWRRTPSHTEEIAVLAGRRAVALTSELLFTTTGDSGPVYVRALDSSSEATVVQPEGYSYLAGVAANSHGTVTLFADANFLYSGVLESGTLSPLAFAGRHQGAPGAAAAGELRLAAWSEYRSSERRSVLVASRFELDGRPRDTLGIVLASPGAFTAPRIASDGTNWLVVFNDGQSLYARRVAADGTLPDPAPFRIGENYHASGFDVDWDGSAYVVTWTSHDGFRPGFSVIESLRVAPDGTFGQPVWLTGQGYGRYPAVAAAPDASLVVWSDGSVRGALLSPSGTVVPLAFPDAFGGSAPDVAFNGSNFLVVWLTPEQNLQWVLVSRTGVVTTPPWNTLPVAAPVTPLLSAQGKNFLLAYAKPQVHLALLSGDGYVLIPPSATRATGSIAIAGSHLVYAGPTPYPIRTDRVSIAFIVRVGSFPKRHVAGH